jgi:hypothetical protein
MPEMQDFCGFFEKCHSHFRNKMKLAARTVANTEMILDVNVRKICP